MGTPKRDRQKAARQARLDQARAEEARRKRNRTVRNAALFVALVVVIALVIARPWQSDDEEVAADEPVPTPCPAEDGSSEPRLTFDAAPPECIDPAASYLAEVETTEGDFTIELDAANAPVTVNNFVVLARYHFYDDVPFHRIIQGFVNQTGDPTGDPVGTGDPGYTIPDELPTDTPPYPAGSVAMANSGPDTSGGQWFVVVGSGGDQLQPAYSRFGQVVEGQEVVDAINAEFGSTGPEGTPTGDVRVESVTIVEGDAADAAGSTTTVAGGESTTTTAPGESTTTTTAPGDPTTITTAPGDPTTTTAG